MIYHLRGLISLTARFLLCGLFFLSAVGNKIPHFDQTVDKMAKVGVPEPKTALTGAIAFLIVGSLSIVFGCWARFGALLLLLFLGAATYYFHPFWKLAEEPAKTQEMIQALKNAGLAGGLLLILANGAGPWSLDGSGK